MASPCLVYMITFLSEACAEVSAQALAADKTIQIKQKALGSHDQYTAHPALGY